jgi:hypothetical protein
MIRIIRYQEADDRKQMSEDRNGEIMNPGGKIIGTASIILILAIQIPPRRDCKFNDKRTDVLLPFPASRGKIQATCSAGGR